MKIPKIAGYFILFYVITVMVNAATIYFYNLIVYGSGKFTWGITFTLSLIISAAITLIVWKTAHNKGGT